MSQDERAPLPVEEGEIHEWLDGELPAARAAELEALTHSSPEFAQRVAEARGLIAASSRILGALDDVPAGVLPNASVSPVAATATVGSTATPDAVNQTNTLSARTVRRWSWRRVSSIAALLMVGVTGVVVVQRTPVPSEADAVVRAEAFEEKETAVAAAPPAPLSPPAVVQRPVTAPFAGAPEAVQSPAAPAAAASARVAASARAAAPTPAVAAEPSVSRTSRESLTAASSQALAAALPPKPTDSMLDAAAKTAQSQTPSQTQSLGGRPMQRRAASVIPGASRFSSGSVLSASGANSADVIVSEQSQSDVAPAALLFGVQRVQCAPNCVQQRIEIARDGRLRRFTQTLGRPTTTDTSSLDEAALTALGQQISALRLDTLPAVLQLDGSKCYSAGSLRESLRVSFVHNNAPRQVMGLPWCTDGKHVLDRAAQLIEEAAGRRLGGVSGLIRQ